MSPATSASRSGTAPATISNRSASWNATAERYSPRIDALLERFLVRPDGGLPAARYTDPEMVALEHERLWSRVWQIACRAEALPAAGDRVVYTLGSRSAPVLRAEPPRTLAFHDACPHPATAPAGGRGHSRAGC